MIKSHIVDGGGSNNEAHVKDDALVVTHYTCPPLMPQKCKVFSQYLTDDGLSSGDEDMGIDGSVTEVEYFISANSNDDRYINKLIFLVGYGASAGLWKFADSVGALANGVKLSYRDTYGGEVEIGILKSNGDFLRQSLGSGIIPTAWELRHLGANNDYGFLCAIDISQLIPPYGIKLDRGTNQKLVITIRDDCTDADDFNCRAYGFDRFE